MPRPRSADAASPVRGATDGGRGTSAAVVVSALAGLLAAVLSVPGAFLLWVGISVAVGRGDPTWNDGEEVWGTGVGLSLTALVVLMISLGSRAVNRRVRLRIRAVVTGLWLVPVLAVHAAFAITFLVG